MSNAVLQARGLSLSFGSLAAVRGVDLTLTHGARHALIGPNGAGKTTLINLLSGRLAPDYGGVFLEGCDVTRLSTDARVRRGLVRTFQINSVFPGLTTSLSLVLAICEREGMGAHWWRSLRRQTHAFDEAGYWLDQFGLADVGEVPARHLSYGQQRLLEIALALACRPRVLLLDEPAAGLSAYQSSAVLDAVNALPADITILLIEHDMNLVFDFADTITVLADGQVVACGPPDRIASSAHVRSLYLGTP